MVVTFVPFFDVEKIYRIMNLKHKNKQITECIQLVKALQGEVQGYANHAATLMWKGYVDALKTYHNIMLRLWYAEGYKGSRKEYEVDEENAEWPWWWGWDTLALSHKLSLYRKKPEHYTMQILELEEDLLPLKNKCGYVWPSHLLERYGDDYEYIKSLNIEELCDPIGAGAPIQYRWSLDDICGWEQDESRNPRTERTLTSKSKESIYGQLREARDYYLGVGLLCQYGQHTFYWTLELVLQWLDSRDEHPVTGDPLAPDERTTCELVAAEAYYRREYYIY